jgi:hypothetical protein
MERYLKAGLFRTLERSFIYLERTVSGGDIRRGLSVCSIWRTRLSARSTSAVRASEKTILSRLPPRLEIRRRAALEMPHIWRSSTTLTVSSSNRCPAGRTVSRVYDFELMEGGGTVWGWRVRAASVTR